MIWQGGTTQGGLGSDSTLPFENLSPSAIVTITAKAPQGNDLDDGTKPLHSSPLNWGRTMIRRGGAARGGRGSDSCYRLKFQVPAPSLPSRKKSLARQGAEPSLGRVQIGKEKES